MGILKVETEDGQIVDVLSKEESISKRGTKTLLINGGIFLKKRDYVIFECDESGEVVRQQFRFRNKFFQDKIYKADIQTKKTNLKNYGVENPYQAKEVQEKIKQTNLEKYGVENPLQNKQIGNRARQTQMDRNGGKLGFNNDKQKQTIKERYGDEEIFKTKHFREKYTKTMMEKYGTEAGGMSSPEIRKTIEQTNLEKYGVKYFVQSKEFSELTKENKFIISKKQQEVKDYIESLGIETKYNVRSIIEKQEIDIYIPSHNLAIEFDGMFWHCDRFKEKSYHRDKTRACEEKGIRLIHIFEDEWMYKQDIVKARLKNMLGKNSNRIGARKTEIREIEPSVKNQFLEKYHIQGKDNCRIKLGAFYGDELIGVMTFSKPRLFMNQKKRSGEIWELGRFATISDTYTPGLASKMLKYFENNYDWDEIYSYADRRWSQGNLYKSIGFEFDSETNINYFYWDGQKRRHRYGFRKSELKNFPNYLPEKTEHQIMDEAGYLRIYDCGNYKYVKLNDK